MRACCSDPVSSDNQGEEASWFSPSPDRAMSVNHVRTSNSNASGPISDGS